MGMTGTCVMTTVGVCVCVSLKYSRRVKEQATVIEGGSFFMLQLKNSF